MADIENAQRGFSGLAGMRSNIEQDLQWLEEANRVTEARSSKHALAAMPAGRRLYVQPEHQRLTLRHIRNLLLIIIFTFMVWGCIFRGTHGV